MPTPSSNAPDPQSPRQFSFSCPDPAEGSEAEGASQAEHPLPPPSNWRPGSMSIYDNRSGVFRMEDDAARSRSATLLTPAPETGTREQVMEPEGLVISRESSEDSQKQLELDEDILGTSAGGPIVRMGGAADAESSSSRTVTEGEPGRRQRDHDLASPLPGEEGMLMTGTQLMTNRVGWRTAGSPGWDTSTRTQG